MKVDVLLGLQWGDEGKGKLADLLALNYDVVARFQGGPNAGHTLNFDGIKHVLHQIPSGIFREKTENIIGNGVVLDPITFKKEIEELSKFNIDVRNNLYISKRAQLILPTHKLLDTVYEESKGNKKIGTTLRGIGPTYQDKISRIGLRVGDILESDFEDRYNALVKKHKALLKSYNLKYNLIQEEKDFTEALNFLKEFRLINSEYLINNHISSQHSILAEGAQGSLLDIDFGSYPFVTSSSTISAAACTGLGIAPQNIREVFGVFKAYCTRVGGGPFPTELHDETGNSLRTQGQEFGATTSRPRRCGWLDLPALKYACIINGVTQLFMMKVDVLNNFDEIKVCTEYRQYDGSLTKDMPFKLSSSFEPVYKSFKGWNCNLENTSDLSALPTELKEYASFIESYLELPIRVVSFGPDRLQTILHKELQINPVSIE